MTPSNGFLDLRGLHRLLGAIVVTRRSPITCAMSLVATFFFLAGLYVPAVGAHHRGAAMLVYAGAIMVLFLFVIMLLSLGDIAPVRRSPSRAFVGGSPRSVLRALLFSLSALARAAGDYAWVNDRRR